MELSSFFPMWNKLTAAQQQTLAAASFEKAVDKGTVIHNGSMYCTGLLLVQTGQLRAYGLSEDGREITLYRLFERDMCLFSAACIMNSFQAEITIEAEKDSRLLVIPAEAYKDVMTQSAPLAVYTSELMAARVSELMWRMEQILWKSLDKRLAEFLLEESSLEGSDVVKATHETIGSHLGSPREVVTRMLRDFQNEGMVKLSRGSVELTNRKKLAALLKN